MKKLISIIAIASLLLCGCGKKEVAKIAKPYEIKVGNKILSYYDDKSEFEDAGFAVGEWSAIRGIDGERELDAIAIINDEGDVRSVIVKNDDVITYKGITVGDDAKKVEKAFKYAEDGDSSISVFFYDGKETSLKKFKEEHLPIDDDYSEAQHNMVIIDYRIDDDNEIESIMICDYKYAIELN